jgi:signal transduction histidine kinase
MTRPHFQWDCLIPEGTIIQEQSVSRSSSRTVGLVSTLSVSGTFRAVFAGQAFRLPYTRGTGLGLSIISSLLKILGGSIQVESEVGKGTIFTLTVPLQVPLNQSKTIEDSQLIS